MRKACMEPISFRPDGTIAEVEMTTQGVGGPMSPLLRMEASRACLMSGNLWTTVRRPPHDTPVEYLTGIRNNDCAYWKYYDFNLADVNHFICKTWDKNTEAGLKSGLTAPTGRCWACAPLQPRRETWPMPSTKQTSSPYAANMPWCWSSRVRKEKT